MHSHRNGYNGYSFTTDIRSRRLPDEVKHVAIDIADFASRCLLWCDGWGTLSVMKPGESPRTAFYDPSDEESLADLAVRAARRNLEDGCGVHLGMATRRENLARGRGGEKDVCQAATLWFDVDDLRDGIYAGLANLNMPPHMIVQSGGGYHAYWWLQAPTAADGYLAAVLRGLAEHVSSAIGIEADEAVTTIDSMMRVPGTYNHKPDRQCWTLIAHDDIEQRLYAYDAFRPLVQPTTPQVRRISRPRIATGTRETTVTAAEIAARLGAEKRGSYWMARCPVPTHGKGKGDHNPSLSITEVDDKILLNCHAGCDTERIVEALGLQMGNLFLSESRPATTLEMRSMLRGRR